MENLFHVIYIALDPLKYPRIRKIAYSLKNCKDVKFDVMIPKFRFVYRGGKIGRLFFAFLNYFTTVLQVFFVHADVFWVANCPDILVLPLVLRKKRYVLEYRSPWAIEVEHEFGRGPWVHFTSFFERLALKNSWIITLTSSKLLRRVKSYGKPTFVIPNYPLKSFGKLRLSREEFRRSHGYSEKDKIILFIGKLTHVEGADLLPKIAEEVFIEDAEAVFWIVGDGPLYEKLKKFSEKFPKRFKLFGWQPHTNIPNFIKASDVCIAPRHASPFSVFYNEEGVSKFSEYMFFEKPIVACGVAKSNKYLLVKEGEMAKGILRALRGEIRNPRRMTWEDYSEKRLLELFNLIRPGRI